MIAAWYADKTRALCDTWRDVADGRPLAAVAIELKPESWTVLMSMDWYEVRMDGDKVLAWAAWMDGGLPGFAEAIGGDRQRIVGPPAWSKLPVPGGLMEDQDYLAVQAAVWKLTSEGSW